MAETGRESIDSIQPLLLQVHEGALGTVEDGKPFVSATGFLYTSEGVRFNSPPGRSIHLLLSDLSRHSKNLAKCPEASLLVVENSPGIPIHEKKRVSLQGKVERVESKEMSVSLKDQYLKIFPRSEIFFTLPDFRFYELKISQIHWIGGFGKAATWP
ncbi:MAG: pyridoxamine 5'-phosphate oxidase family protein [Candidatus Omnitrophica bacterium]|nr:pyridoxamine 5'-phosphate oxidase family protein [Candidatus Omnitrophota bacterium]